MQEELAMKNRVLLLALGLTLGSFSLFAQESPTTPQVPTKPVIVVNAFTAAPDVAWPYNMQDMQKQTIAELKAKFVSQYEIVAEAPKDAGGMHVYTLSGEIVGWRPGNAAKRVLVGMGSGRESADIHYWMTDDTGQKIMDKKDTIRAEFWGNAYAGSVGQLSHPFASKISQRIEDAKLK
jgi:hypothetical protein